MNQNQNQVKVPTVVYKDRDVRIYKNKEIVEKIVEVEDDLSSRHVFSM